MAYKVIKAEIVKKDVVEALDYYDSISFDLGNRFEAELENTFDEIENAPFKYFNLEKGYRRAHLKNFPYMVIYKIEHEEVLVVAVLDQRKDPALLEKRLK